MQHKQLHPPLPFIRELCSHLNEEELTEAEENFWRYIETVRGICSRLERERLEKDELLTR